MRKISIWWDKMKKKGQKGIAKIRNKFRKKMVDEEQKETSSMKIEERKKRKNLFPSLVIMSSKKAKKIALITIPSLFLVVGIGIGISFMNNDRVIEKEVVIETSKTYHRVYLLSNDDYVIPLSVKMDKRQTTQEELLEVFSCLKTSSKIATNNLHGYIPDDTKINQLLIDNGHLIIDMSKEFLDYSETNELKMLESLTYTFLDFNDIDSLSLKVDGNLLSLLPKNNIIINNPLTLELGINKPVMSPLSTLNKASSIVYYAKRINGQSYYVPMTVLTDKEDSRIKDFYNATKVKQSITTGLSSLATYQQIDYQIEPLVSDNDIVIGVTDDSLMEEGIIKEDIYELLLMSFSLMGIDQTVSLQVNGESYEVNGYGHDDTVPVSSVYYNEVAI